MRTGATDLRGALTALVAATTVAVAGCGGPKAPATLPAAAAPAATSQPAPNAPAAPATTTPAPVDDPVARLIASAEQHFAAGQTHLRAGRLVKARGEFDAAISVLLRAPGGAKSDPRLNAEYEQLLARIAALEATALRQGDGFSESTTEPAAIDELLAVATFPRATPSTETAVAKEVGEALYDLPVISNDKVLSYVELFQGTLRPFLEQGLSRGSRYLPRIRSIFETEGVPLDLAYVPLIESAYKSTALSRAKAKGMWQFQLPTAGDYKLRFDWFIDERSDFEKSTRAAARHFKMLANMFDGDWNLALAAYNVGQGRVQTAIKRAKTDDYWELTNSTRYLPKDTRAYVPMIWAAIIIAKSPAEFGFDIETQPALDYDIVAVPNAIRLDTVAEWAGTTIEVLRDLNPELRRQTTPMGPYNLRLPLGTKGDVEEKLWVADPSTFTSFVKHTVKSGETLSTIARRYRIATTELAEMNGIKRTARLRQGQALYVPGALTGPAATAAASGRAASRGTVTYQVKRGDTLYEIARQFDVTVDELKSWNNLKSSVLAIGKRLTIHRN